MRPSHIQFGQTWCSILKCEPLPTSFFLEDWIMAQLHDDLWLLACFSWQLAKHLAVTFDGAVAWRSLMEASVLFWAQCQNLCSLLSFV
jgi:hypothetical protein